ncbi:hypothetical protein C8J42_101917 [Sphingomonas sp. PP-CE-1A-559]|nr:hypothetical protein C8J42_101917 [Sphingomonas sp. PP-CE-1A-559]
MTLIIGEASKPANGLVGQPILIAAIITFAGVLLTVVVGTFANFRLANKRNEFDKDLAKQRFENDKNLAEQNLLDEKTARQEARSRELSLRRIDFQRQNLLTLQQSVHSLINKTHQMCRLASDVVEKKPNISWKSAVAEGELKNEIPEIFTTVALCEVRSVNEEIRCRTDGVRKLVDSVLSAESREDALKKVDDLKKSFEPFLIFTGEVIRELDRN